MTPDDILFPKGPVQAGWFVQGQDGGAIIVEWIVLAEEMGAPSDEAILAYVEWRARSMVADRLAAQPISESWGGHARAFHLQQISAMRKDARAAKEIFDAALLNTSVSDIVDEPTSGSIRNVFVL